jgi:cysteinyl-tRNA synthetase
MSKSLKNFTSIREALTPDKDGIAPWTSRLLRITLLTSLWNQGIEITDGIVQGSKSWEEKVTNFFFKAVDLQRSASESNGTSSRSSSSTLRDALQKAEKDTNDALSDSFNTPIVMQVISQLVTDANSIPANEVDAEAFLDVARWITRMVTIFGLNGKADPKDTSQIGWEGVQIPAAAQPFIYPLSQLRDEVRKQARAGSVSPDAIVELASAPLPAKITAESKPYADIYAKFQSDVKAAATGSENSSKQLLSLTDALRNVQLWDLDIYLEDRDAPLPAMVRPLDISLKQARAEKERLAEEKRAAKEKRDREEAEKKRLRDEAAKVSHKDLFRTNEYSEWDGDGLPTKDAEGKEVVKSKKKKLVKEWEKQKKLHEQWLKEQKP